MATDAYGQGIETLDYDDAPDLVILGGQLSGGLTPRSNMRFASAAARDAVIDEPVEGMEAWLVAENLKTMYDGTAWVVVAAGSQAWTKPALFAGFTHNGNSNGDFRWRVVNLFGEPTVMLQGGIGVTYSPAIPNGGILLASPLPLAARPSTLRSLLVTTSDVASERNTLKLDAQPDGHFKIIGANSSTIRPPWISMNGLYYSL